MGPTLFDVVKKGDAAGQLKAVAGHALAAGENVLLSGVTGDRYHINIRRLGQYKIQPYAHFTDAQIRHGIDGYAGDLHLSAPAVSDALYEVSDMLFGKAGFINSDKRILMRGAPYGLRKLRHHLPGSQWIFKNKVFLYHASILHYFPPPFICFLQSPACR